MKNSIIVLAALFALLISLSYPKTMTAQEQTPASTAATANHAGTWQTELAAWRADYEKGLSAADGWLTLVGLEWLKSGVNSVGAAADNQIKLPESSQAPEHLGLITVNKKTVQLLPPSGGFPADLKINGQPARKGLLAVEGSNPSIITWRSLTMLVIERGGRYALRIKDADSSTRTGFHGANWYPPNPELRVTAQWIPFVPAHIERIPTIIGTTLDLPAPGVAEFTLDGQTLRLEPVLEDPTDKTLFFILRDETSKTTTYQAARFLHTGFPDHGLEKPGSIVLDFNRLRNPPCAYTPYATCPLPPEQNRLPVAIEAGEKRYSH
jgi:uncharacterized protein